MRKYALIVVLSVLFGMFVGAYGTLSLIEREVRNSRQTTSTELTRNVDVLYTLTTED